VRRLAHTGGCAIIAAQLIAQEVSLRRKSGVAVWVFLIAAALIIFLVWQFTGYRTAIRTLPTGMTIAGLPVEGLTREEALNALEVSFAEPVELRYAGQMISLFPDTVGLSYDADQTAAALDAVLAGRQGPEGFVNHITRFVLRRTEEPITIPVTVTYSSERLDGFLERVAEQYDQAPAEPAPDVETLSFASGQPGYELDAAASRARVAAALVSASERQAELVVRTSRAQPQGGSALEEMLRSLLEAHPGITPGIFVKNMATGTELAINGGVAFDGLGVVRIALLAETYRVHALPLPPEVSAWVSQTMGAADDAASADNLLAGVLDRGDSYEGAQALNMSMHGLGLVNTFISTPYRDERAFVRIATPANMRTDVNTNADLRMQTTPTDMGLLLEMIYQCSQGGGSLAALYPDAFSPEECGEMLAVLSANRTDSLIEAGVPDSVVVAHKQGFSNDTHADAGLVFGEQADFVLVVYLYRPEFLAYEESSALATQIATAAYNYFNQAN